MPALGRVPLRRPLPLLREALVAKHLQSAARKLTTSRLTGAARERLSQLIERALAQSQIELRDARRGRLITAVLAAEGLRPRNVPERVAFRKIVEELLDRIVRQGYLSFGHIRDTLSQNNLKLPDLTRLRELITGDLLLRIDSRLGAGAGRRLSPRSRLSAGLAPAERLGVWHSVRPLSHPLSSPCRSAEPFSTVEGLRHIVHLFDDRCGDAAAVGGVRWKRPS